MKANYPFIFLTCIEVILRNEGGYINHPSDPGGETKFGICKRYYPDLDIKNLTREKAIEIYYKDYWLKMNLQGIRKSEVVLELFDMGVNVGIRMATKLAQKLVHAFADGVIGPETTGKINDFPADFTELYKCDRKKFYIALARRKPEFSLFLKGWLNRVDKCKF